MDLPSKALLACYLTKLVIKTIIKQLPSVINARDNSLGTTPVHPHLTNTYSHFVKITCLGCGVCRAATINYPLRRTKKQMNDESKQHGAVDRM